MIEKQFTIQKASVKGKGLFRGFSEKMAQNFKEV